MTALDWYGVPADSRFDDAERERLYWVRLAAKRGGTLTDGEVAFCEAMLEKDFESYRAIGRRVSERIREEFELSRGEARP